MQQPDETRPDVSSPNPKHRKVSNMANKGPVLQPGGQLFKDDFLLSPSGQYQCILQQDGNLVIYDLRNNHNPIWASQTYGKAVNVAVMQGDGNFVIYGYPKPIWATNTYGHGPAFLQMQDDGNLVVYQINAPEWASKNHPRSTLEPVTAPEAETEDALV